MSELTGVTSEGIKELFESCELTTFRKGGTGNEYS